VPFAVTVKVARSALRIPLALGESNRVEGATPHVTDCADVNIRRKETRNLLSHLLRHPLQRTRIEKTTQGVTAGELEDDLPRCFNKYQIEYRNPT
jgi:hypothetical protein